MKNTEKDNINIIDEKNKETNYSIRDEKISIWNIPVSIFLVIKKYGFICFFHKVVAYKKLLANKLKNLLRTGVSSIKKEGLSVALLRSFNFIVYGKGVLNKDLINSSSIDFGRWLLKLTSNEVEKLRNNIEEFKHKPKISVITPVYNVESRWLNECIKSVRAQIYTNWELCLYDDASTKKETLNCLKSWENIDSRIKIIYGKENKNISGASNEALKNATGEFIALLDNDDEIKEDALYWIVNEINLHHDVDLVYTDECKKTIDNRYTDFIFKPDWSPEYLLNDMYTGHLSVYKKEIVEKVGFFRSDYNYSQDYDLALRVSEVTDKIFHVEKVLYFWRQIPGSAAAGGKDFAQKTNLLALEDAMRRRGFDVKVTGNSVANRAEILFNPNEKVSIVIPSDSGDNLKKSINSIIKKTNYTKLEIVIVTNSALAGELKLYYANKANNLVFSTYDKKYNFSDKCNQGADVATGEIVIFLNDDVFPISDDWIMNLIEFLYFDRKIGSVSPKLLWENDTIQYAGMTTNSKPFCGTFLNGKNKNEPLANRVRNVSILSGACFAIRKKVFFEVGGFDAVNTPAGHSDLDLSFRLRDKGYRCVYTPYSTLHHIGNHSWHIEKDKADIFVLKRWGKYVSNDPYYTKSMRAQLEGYLPEQFGIFSHQENLIEHKFDALIVVHELTMTGAPMVALNMARSVINSGGYPVVYSYVDGPFRAAFEELDIVVIVNNFAQDNDFIFKYFAKNFDIIIANTVVTYPAVYAMEGLVPIIWFIHEAWNIQSFFIPHFSMKKPSLEYVLKNTKASVYVASEYSKEAVVKYLNNVKVLSMGFDDQYCNEEMKIDGKIQFSMVGTVEERKAQDVFVAAILELPVDYRQRAVFNIIGNEQAFDSFALKLKEKTNGIDNVIWHGLIIDQNRKKKIFTETNVFVVVSREEPTSIVAIEGAMLGRPSIISQNVGAKYIIEDGKTGFVIETNNVEQLKSIIIKIIDNPQSLILIGQEARKRYLSTSTFDLFQSNFLRAIDERLAE